MAFLKLEDYAIFAVTLIVTMGMGLYFSRRRGGKQRKHRSTSDYLRGDGNMSSLPVAVSLMVSYESGIMMLGVPAEVYMYANFQNGNRYILGHALPSRSLPGIALRCVSKISVHEIMYSRICLKSILTALRGLPSTMSSLLCGITAIFWEDVVKPHTKPMSDRRATLITRLSVVLFGMLSIAVAFVVSGLTGPVSQILDTTESCLVGAVCGVFILGWLIPWANSTGALVGGSVSVLFVGWISFGQYASSGVRVTPRLPPASIERHGLDLLYSLSYKWLGPIGILIVIGVGSLVSRLQVPMPVDPSLVVPVCDLLCCCIPTPIRKRLRCGFNYTEAYDVTREKAESAIPNGRSGQVDTAVHMLTGHRVCGDSQL